MGKKKKSQGVKNFPWESPHPVGHRRNYLKGKALAKKYPEAKFDLMDVRLPGSFENGKNR